MLETLLLCRDIDRRKWVKTSMLLKCFPDDITSIIFGSDWVKGPHFFRATLRKIEVEVESSADHPYFVYGQGWASCRPEQTMATYGLKCHLLQVGDVCISLSPRPPGSDRKRRWSAPDQLPDPEQPADLHKPRTQVPSP